MADPTLRLGIDPRGATVGARQFSKASGRIQNSARAASASVNTLDKRLKATTATSIGFFRAAAGATAVIAVARAFGDTANTIAEYEFALARAASVTDNFSGQLVEVEALLKKLGATTLFSARQAAEGAAFLGLAGFEASEIIAALPAVLDLAIAGTLEMGRAADIASNIMAQFQLSAEQIRPAIDAMTNTVASSNTNIEQLAEAMKLAGPIANQLGVTLEQTTAAIGSLGNSGIQGSIAGTGLRQTMLSLIAPSEKAKKAISNMRDATTGLALNYRDLNVEAFGLIPVLRRLADAEISVAEAEAIFQRRAVGPALTLIRLSKDSKEYTAAAAKLAETMNLGADQATGYGGALQQLADANAIASSSEDGLTTSTELLNARQLTLSESGEVVITTSREVARVMQDNLKGSFIAFTSAVEAVQLAIGDAGFTGALRSVVDASRDTLRVMAGMEDEVKGNVGAYKAAAASIEIMTAALVFWGASRLNAMIATRVAMLGAHVKVSMQSATVSVHLADQAVRTAQKQLILAKAQSSVAATSFEVAVAQKIQIKTLQDAVLVQTAYTAALIARKTALTAVAVAEVGVATATTAAAVAMTAGARAMAFMGAAAKSVLGFFGGWVGLALTAAQVMFLFSLRTTEAEQSLSDFNKELKRGFNPEQKNLEDLANAYKANLEVSKRKIAFNKEDLRHENAMQEGFKIRHGVESEAINARIRAITKSNEAETKGLLVSIPLLGLKIEELKKAAKVAKEYKDYMENIDGAESIFQEDNRTKMEHGFQKTILELANDRQGLRELEFEQKEAFLIREESMGRQHYSKMEGLLVAFANVQSLEAEADALQRTQQFEDAESSNSQALATALGDRAGLRRLEADEYTRDLDRQVAESDLSAKRRGELQKGYNLARLAEEFKFQKDRRNAEGDELASLDAQLQTALGVRTAAFDHETDQFILSVMRRVGAGKKFEEAQTELLRTYSDLRITLREKEEDRRVLAAVSSEERLLANLLTSQGDLLGALEIQYNAEVRATKQKVEDNFLVEAEGLRQLALLKEIYAEDQAATKQRLAAARGEIDLWLEAEDLIAHTLTEASRAGADFDDILKTIVLSIQDIAIQALIVKPAIDALFGALNGQGQRGDGLLKMGLSSILGAAASLFGGSISAGTTTGSGGFNTLRGGTGPRQIPLGGSPHGGEFIVPGGSNGGVDNKIISMAMQGGETVRVTPPHQSSSGGGDTEVSIQIFNQSGAKATVKERTSRTASGGSKREVDIYIASVVAKDADNKGPAFRAGQSAQRGSVR